MTMTSNREFVYIKCCKCKKGFSIDIKNKISKGNLCSECSIKKLDEKNTTSLDLRRYIIL